MSRTITVMPIKPPLVLYVVRAVLIVWGLLAVIGTLDGMLRGSFFVGIGVLNLYAGTALLRGSRSWRLFVLGMLWYLFIGAGIVLYVMSQSMGPVTVVVLGMKVATISRGAMVGVILGMVVVGVWMHVVLCSPQIRAFFDARPWPLVDPALFRMVDRLEGLQGRAEHDVMVARRGQLERAIARLRALREELAELSPEQVISEARYMVDDLLARALRIHRAHLGNAPDKPADSE